MGPEQTVLARATTDARDRLIEADEPLAGLQRRCGGELPGTIAVPQLLEVVRKARTLGLRLARSITAFDADEMVRAWVEIAPVAGAADGGCSIAIVSWSQAPVPPLADAEAADRRIAIDRELAELTARLDRTQRPLAVECRAPDLAELASAMRDTPGGVWSDHLSFPALAHRQPLHWRLLDGASCIAAGSARKWTVTLVPLGRPEPGSAGFELLLVADAPLPELEAPSSEPHSIDRPVLGRELAPVLRQPIARIIANAETIRSRLAGPLAEEYSNYAADIASAGQHLLSLVEDLSDLEMIESEDFTVSPDRIDLADVARRAVGILGVRARAKSITLSAPGESATRPATGEFRRVLQILLNLIGNAINYSPAGSRVTVTVEGAAGQALVAVTDEGPGLTPAQAQKVFEKFERLGRGGDGGSGLGLYISRKLARAMRGDLAVESKPAAGARFTLELPGGD